MSEKIDFKKLKPVNYQPKMQDPLRFPKVQGPMEQEMKDIYDLELNRMLIDVTRYIADAIRRPT